MAVKDNEFDRFIRQEVYSGARTLSKDFAKQFMGLSDIDLKIHGILHWVQHGSNLLMGRIANLKSTIFHKKDIPAIQRKSRRKARMFYVPSCCRLSPVKYRL